MCCDGPVLTRRPHAGRWSDPLIAAGTFGIGVVLYLVGLYQLGTGPTDVALGLRIGLLALMCVADVFRRAHPAAALAAGSVVFAADLALGPTIPIWLVLTDLVYAAVRYGSARVSRAVCYLTAVAVAALATVVYVAEEDIRFAAGAGVVTALFFGTPVWWGLAIRRQTEIAAAERERARAQEVLAELDREAAVTHERATMARDLHDVIASHLSAIAIHSEAALSADGAYSDPALHTVLKAIRSSSVAGLSEMKSMIELLRATDPDTTPDPRAAPPRLVELPVVVDAARATGSTVDARVEVDAGALPSIVDHTAYRIAQEALTNALKHAPGEPIDVSIRLCENTLHLDVRNPLAPGRPSAPESTGAHGLANMRHRAGLLGGTLHAGATDRTWRVSARLPVTTAGGDR